MRHRINALVERRPDLVRGARSPYPRSCSLLRVRQTSHAGHDRRRRERSNRHGARATRRRSVLPAHLPLVRATFAALAPRAGASDLPTKLSAGEGAGAAPPGLVSPGGPRESCGGPATPCPAGGRAARRRAGSVVCSARSRPRRSPRRRALGHRCRGGNARRGTAAPLPRMHRCPRAGAWRRRSSRARRGRSGGGAPGRSAVRRPQGDAASDPAGGERRQGGRARGARHARGARSLPNGDDGEGPVEYARAFIFAG
jgi:hypothetical protein